MPPRSISSQAQCPTALLGFPIQVLGPAVGNVQCADVYGIHRAQLVSVDRVMYAAADQQRHDQRAEVFDHRRLTFFCQSIVYFLSSSVSATM